MKISLDKFITKTEPVYIYIFRISVILTVKRCHVMRVTLLNIEASSQSEFSVVARMRILLGLLADFHFACH